MSGQANGNYKNGRYSKSLPAQLREHYLEARNSPRLLSLADDLAVAEARLSERLQVVGQGDSEALWQSLREALDLFSQALATGDMSGMNSAFATMRRLITDGGDQAAAWREIRELWVARCKLVQTEVKTLQGLQQMVTTQQMMLVLGRVTDTITRAVQAHAETKAGQKILRDVMADFTELATIGEK